MKLILIALAVVLVISSIQAAPGKSANKCSDCDLDYKPVCAGPAGTTDKKAMKSFGSICVMEKYNCEKSEHLVKLSDGECPGGQSVRLQ